MATAEKQKGNPAPISAKKAAKERQQAAARRRRQQQQVILGIGAVALLAAVILAIIVSNQPVEAAVSADVKTEFTDYKWGTTPDGFFWIGREDAPSVMEEFASFSCPACLSWHDSVFESLKDKFKAGDVKLILYPLTTYGHFNSDGMARAAICAGQQGKFWEMHEVMYDWQTRYGEASENYTRLSLAAGELGLDTGKFDSCMKSDETKALIDKAAALSVTRGVTATPTVYFDSVKIYPLDSGAPGLSEIRGMIEAKLVSK